MNEKGRKILRLSRRSCGVSGVSGVFRRVGIQPRWRRRACPPGSTVARVSDEWGCVAEESVSSASSSRLAQTGTTAGLERAAVPVARDNNQVAALVANRLAKGQMIEPGPPDAAVAAILICADEYHGRAEREIRPPT